MPLHWYFNPLNLLGKMHNVAVLLPCTGFSGSMPERAHIKRRDPAMAEHHMTSEQALPPYFNINPNTALGGLGAPTTTEDFARIARACEAAAPIWQAGVWKTVAGAVCASSPPGKSPAT